MGQIGTQEREQMEENMAAWKERGRGGGSTNLDGTPSATNTSGDGEGSLPLGQGEWDEPLGLPLCVVCQNVSQTNDAQVAFPFLTLTLSQGPKNGVFRKAKWLERTRL